MVIENDFQIQYRGFSRTGASAVRLLVAGALVSLGCGKAEPLPEATARPVVRNYAAMVYANYSDALAQAQAMKSSVDAFVADPTAAKLEAAKQAWIDCRTSYGQSEVYRFYGGPIDDPATDYEGLINSWPLDEAYIDSVKDAPNSGIINDPQDFPTLNEDVLANLNTRGGEDNIATGYHAIEFLLWGQDFNPNGPGNRPYTDYVDGSTTASNPARRRQYLSAVTSLLIKDLTAVRDAWTPGQDDYARSLSTLDLKTAVQRMITGMGSMSGGELGHQRITVAYDTKDQNDEHSCFSDNTLADLHANALGIQNVYLGHYGNVQGPGLSALVAAVDPALDEKMKAQLQASLDALQAIPYPFDQAILGPDSSPGRQKIKAAIDALQAQTDTLVEVATALGVQIELG